ncbi:MAG: phage tail sheath subtilisin-like domain-containing protein, partial [Hyphomicrobiaceae bacterium]
QKDTVYSPIQTTDTSTIGMLYTAPNADPDKYPLNVPKLFLADRWKAADLGTAGTGHDAFAAIYRHVGVPVVAVRVEQALTAEQTIANMIGDYATRSGSHAFYSAKNTVFKVPKILIAPGGYSAQRVTGGITQIVIGAGGAGYTAANTRIVINANGHGGGAKAIPVISQGVLTGVQIVNCGIGYSAQHVTFAIVGDGENATISDFEIGTAANPIIAELGGIGNRMRSTIIADCPNATAEQSAAYRHDWATERIYCVDNWGLVADQAGNIGAQPNSAAVAGLLASVDNDEGFWVSPSNRVVQGLLGTSRPIDDSGVGGEADYLNMDNDVATIMHRGSGFKLFGNHGCSTDPLWKMFAAGRTRDALYDSIEAAIDAKDTDKPLNLQFYEGVCESINEKLRYWESIGAIIGGKIWVDPALNPPLELVAGRPKFSMDFEPVGVAEDIQIIAARNPGYYADLVNQVVLQIAA